MQEVARRVCEARDEARRAHPGAWRRQGRPSIQVSGSDRAAHALGRDRQQTIIKPEWPLAARFKSDALRQQRQGSELELSPSLPWPECGLWEGHLTPLCLGFSPTK